VRHRFLTQGTQPFFAVADDEADREGTHPTDVRHRHPEHWSSTERVEPWHLRVSYRSEIDYTL